MKNRMYREGSLYYTSIRSTRLAEQSQTYKKRRIFIHCIKKYMPLENIALVSLKCALHINFMF